MHNNEISKLKEKLLLTENELNETKHKLNTYQSNSKKYYENNKDKIIERVKNYNKQNNYKPIVSCDKRKEYNKIANEYKNKIDKCIIKYIPREENEKADKLSKLALK